MASELSEKLKEMVWVVFGGYTIGLLTRKAWEASQHFPNIADTPLVDTEGILYGGVFIFYFLWSITTINGIFELNPIQKAREAWETKLKEKYPKRKYISYFLHILFNTPTTFLLLFMIPYGASIAFAGGLNKNTRNLYLIWLGVTIYGYFLKKSSKPSDKPIEPDTIERSISTLIGMGDTGKQVVMIIFVAFIQGVFQYPNISQHFGGGKPEKVIVFLKKGNSLLLPSQQNLEGRIVDLVFHRGTKYGFKAESWSPSHIVVIDQDKVDRIYAGSGVKELDPTKLQ